MRPGPGVWSVAEYLCHLRDIYVSFTIRLHRIRTEHQPALEPMFNDLRTRRFRYNDCDIDATLASWRDSARKSRAWANTTGTGWRPACRASGDIRRIGETAR